jgi:hypothetical protein
MELSHEHTIPRAVAMRRPLPNRTVVDFSAANGPAVIAVGLATLAAAMITPAVPAVTAMGLVALGATGVMLARFRATPMLVPLVLLNLVTYAGLYALFVGAVLHAASAQASGIPQTQLVDLAVSALPMVAVLWRSIAAICGQDGGRPPRSGSTRAPAR